MALSVATAQTPPISVSATTATNRHNRLLEVLTKCSSIRQLKQVHAQAIRTTVAHHPETLFLFGKMVYISSFHDLNYAFKLFNEIEFPSAFAWNSLIRACARSDDRKEQAFWLFYKMLSEAESVPDKFTFTFVLKACAYLFNLLEGRQVHAHAQKHGFDSDVYVSNSLIHFYTSCGCLEDARRVFDKMPDRSAVSWNALIDGLVQLGELREALEMFNEMRISYEPDGYTMQSVLGACAGLGSLSLGMWAHAYFIRNCDVNEETYILVQNSLVEMYSKCGSLRMAVQVFERMRERNLASWNSMILGYSMYGEAEAAMDLFDRMLEEGLTPNSVTFTSLLNACRHRGLIDDGRKYFDMMIDEYKIRPIHEHYGCLVDLLARAGLIEEALDVVSNMPIQPDLVIWRSLLDACSKKNAGVELSEGVAKKIMESEQIDDSSGVYVLLSRVYAAADRWREAGIVRKLMTDKGVSKEPGCSSIETDGTSHEFFAGDTSHPRSNEIYELLEVIDQRLNSMGYVPDVSQAPMVDGHNHWKAESLKLHSERLAIAFGLLNLKPGIPIRVFKNLSICRDCHKVTKLISSIFNVEIIIRDRIRFHHFRQGSCSCKDYW